MKATKYTMTLITETLSKDSIRSIVSDAIQQLHEHEKTEGFLKLDDGDCVTWKIEPKEVEF